jgi:hypothetical protein
MILPPFGMTDDHCRRVRVGQHLGSDIAGMGTGCLSMTILSADGDPRAPCPRGKAG